jgi:hypothetical protein
MLLLAFTVLLLAGAQDFTPAAPPADIAGWQAATWGMTAAQVRAAFPEAVPLNPPVEDVGALWRLEWRQARLGTYPATAHFEFPPDRDSLCAVEVTVDPSYGGAAVFDALRTALVEKYGRPAGETTTNSRNTFGTLSTKRQVQWLLKSSTIALTWYDAGHTGGVYVRYGQRRPDPTL